MTPTITPEIAPLAAMLLPGRRVLNLRTRELGTVVDASTERGPEYTVHNDDGSQAILPAEKVHPVTADCAALTERPEMITAVEQWLAQLDTVYNRAAAELLRSLELAAARHKHTLCAAAWYIDTTPDRFVACGFYLEPGNVFCGVHRDLHPDNARPLHGDVLRVFPVSPDKLGRPRAAYLAEVYAGIIAAVVQHAALYFPAEGLTHLELLTRVDTVLAEEYSTASDGDILTTALLRLLQDGRISNRDTTTAPFYVPGPVA